MGVAARKMFTKGHWSGAAAQLHDDEVHSIVPGGGSGGGGGGGDDVEVFRNTTWFHRRAFHAGKVLPLGGAVPPLGAVPVVQARLSAAPAVYHNHSRENDGVVSREDSAFDTTSVVATGGVATGGVVTGGVAGRNVSDAAPDSSDLLEQVMSDADAEEVAGRAIASSAAATAASAAVVAAVVRAGAGPSSSAIVRAMPTVNREKWLLTAVSSATKHAGDMSLAAAGGPASLPAATQLAKRMIELLDQAAEQGGPVGRGLHSFPFQLNLSSAVHRITK
jgi:hypothetical protein